MQEDTMASWLYSRILLSRNNYYVFPILQDCTIAVWDIKSPSEIVLQRVLTGHIAGVIAIDFDERYIVSGSGDMTIKVG